MTWTWASLWTPSCPPPTGAESPSLSSASISVSYLTLWCSMIVQLLPHPAAVLRDKVRIKPSCRNCELIKRWDNVPKQSSNIIIELLMLMYVSSMYLLSTNVSFRLLHQVPTQKNFYEPFCWKLSSPS